MSGRYEAFIAANRAIWSRLRTTTPRQGLLLVEAETHPVIAHANGVFARVIGEARDLRIGWIDTGDQAVRRRHLSYDDTSEAIPMRGRPRADLPGAAAMFLSAAMRLLVTGRILDVSLGGVRFGDILYDAYLVRYAVATLPGVDLRLLSTLWILVRQHRAFARLVRRHRPSAVLVSHDIGLNSGVLMRTALDLGVPVYHHRGDLVFASLNLYAPGYRLGEYAYRPRASDLVRLRALGRDRIEAEFAALMAERTNAHADADAVNAYGKGKRVFRSRREFTDEWRLAPDRPLVFVMLHAFNDHPHSHFGRMLFKDYYDWFAETLAYARSHPEVNWVFKEHPSASWYPTRDLVLADRFANTPPHVTFVGADASFSTESLAHVADALVTVAGTAGMEFPALAGVPCIVAGRSSYSGFGFTIEPDSIASYWRTLDDIAALPRLSDEQQFNARMVFVYAQRYASVRYSWAGSMSFEDHRAEDLDARFWDDLATLYATQGEALIAEAERYIGYVRAPGFSRLAALEYPDPVP